MRTKTQLNKADKKAIKLATIDYVLEHLKVGDDNEPLRGVCNVLENASCDVSRTYWPKNAYWGLENQTQNLIWGFKSAFIAIFRPTNTESILYDMDHSYWMETWGASGYCPCCHHKHKPDINFQTAAYNRRIVALGFLRAMVLRGDV